MQFNSTTEDENHNTVLNQDIIGYDPVTGEPIMGNMNSMGSYKNKVKKTPIIVAVATILIVVGIAVSLIKSGIFLDASGKVALATWNTIQDRPHWMKAVDDSDILKGKNPTVDIEGSYADNKLDVTYTVLPEGFDLSAKAVISNGKEINLNGELNENQILLQIPEISENIYTYSYAEGKNGYIKDLLGEEYIRQIDEALDGFYKSVQEQTGETSEAGEQLMKALEDEYASLRFLKEAEKREFVVDGKTVKCKGYKTTISYFNVLNFLDATKDYAETFYGGIGDAWENYKKEYDEARETIREMPDVDMICYIYKNKLACIAFKYGKYELQLKFLGGKTRMENIELSLANMTIFKVTGEVRGSKEKFIFSATEVGDILAIDYDYKTGAYRIETKNGIDTLYISGNLMKKRKNLTMTVDEISGPKIGTIDAKFSMKVYEDGNQVELSGDKIDIGNMSEKDFDDLEKDIEKCVEDLELDSLF